MTTARLSCIFRMALLMATCFMMVPPLCFAEIVEADLRAAVVLGVLKFTYFHQEYYPNNTLSICLVGNPSSAKALLNMTEPFSLQGKNVKVKEADYLAIDQQCDVAVIGKNINSSHEAYFKKPFRPLVICDNCHPKHVSLAAINAYREKSKIRFSIDLKNGDSKKVHFNSSLLELADKVVMP